MRALSWLSLGTLGVMTSLAIADAQQSPQGGVSSYMPIDIKEPLAAIFHA